MRLELEGISCGYGQREILHGLDLSTDAGLVAIVGPNAAGKSTLIKCIAGQMDFRGRISFDGLDIGYGDLRSIDTVGYLPQQHMNAVSMTVYEAVLLGRISHIRWSPSREDRDVVDRTVHDLCLENITDKRINELSGGQLQMVSIAQTLVKEPRLLLMDEPTNNLDLQKQLELFDVVTTLSESRGLVTVTVLHDLNMAARYFDEIVILDHGNVYAQGPACEIINEKMLRDVYGIEAEVMLARDGLPYVVPHRSLNHYDDKGAYRS